jgi:hypothetical protein
MNRQKRVQLDRARKDRQARAHIQRLMSRAGIKRVAAATARLHATRGPLGQGEPGQQEAPRTGIPGASTDRYSMQGSNGGRFTERTA